MVKDDLLSPLLFAQPLAETYYLLKDVDGFLWVETPDGLKKFHGSSFKPYFHDRQNKSSIAGNSIYGLMERQPS